MWWWPWWLPWWPWWLPWWPKWWFWPLCGWQIFEERFNCDKNFQKNCHHFQPAIQCAVERPFVGIITLDHCSLQDIAGKCLRSESWAVTKEKCILHLEIGQRSNSNWGKIGRKFCGWNQPLKLGRNLAKKTGQRGMTCDSLPHKCNTRCWILAVRVDSGNWGLDGCTFSRGVSSSPVLNLSTHPAFFSRKHTLRFCWQ